MKDETFPLIIANAPAYFFYHSSIMYLRQGIFC